jgi:Laminin B (Domain IV)
MNRRATVLAALLVTILVVVCVSIHPASAGVLAVSTFDSDTEGWTAVTVGTDGIALPSNISVAAGAGNPGGALRHLAPSDSRTSYFVAPAGFVAALRSAVGGSISWDLSTIRPEPDDITFAEPDISIRAGTRFLQRNVTPPVPLSPSYARYRLGFDTGSGWTFTDGATSGPATQDQINSVLAGAESLLVRAEYWSSFAPDTGLLDNVIVAGPGFGVVLNRSTARPGDPVEMRVVGGQPGPVDLYVVVALPSSLSAAAGCGGGQALAFLTNSGTAITLACLASPPNTFPRFQASTSVPSGTTLFTIPWPGNAPAGQYVFAAVVTPPGALADGVINPGDLISVSAFALTATP